MNHDTYNYDTLSVSDESEPYVSELYECWINNGKKVKKNQNNAEPLELDLAIEAYQPKR